MCDIGDWLFSAYNYVTFQYKCSCSSALIRLTLHLYHETTTQIGQNQNNIMFWSKNLLALCSPKAKLIVLDSLVLALFHTFKIFVYGSLEVRS